MSVRHVQVRGCLPTLLAVLVVGAILAAVLTTSVALVAAAVVVGLVAGIVRWARRLGRGADATTSAARRRAADVTIDAEVVDRAGPSSDEPPRRLE